MSNPPTSPLARARKEFRGFHGWRVVFAGASVWALQSLIWVQGYGNIAVALRDQFGWSKTFFSIGFAATRAESALLGPPQGMALERWGVRRMMRIGAVFNLVGFAAMAFVQSKAHFLIALGFVAVGMTLAGFLTITTSTVRWFERKRARAVSYTSMGFALGGFASPLLVGSFFAIGWRATLVVAGVVLAASQWWGSSIMGVAPADTGDHVDGVDPADVDSEPRAEGVQDAHFTAREALRTRAFWMIAFGHGSALLVVSGMMAHLTLYLTDDRGYSAGRAAIVAGLVPVFQLLGTAFGGVLGDRFNKRLVAGCAMVAHGVALLMLTWAQHWTMIAAFVVIHGFAWGTRGPQMSALRADYFGTTSFGSIMGWSGLIITCFSIAGPMLAGVLADSTGDYQLGFTILAFGAIAGTVFWFLATPPQTRPASADSVPLSATMDCR